MTDTTALDAAIITAAEAVTDRLLTARTNQSASINVAGINDAASRLTAAVLARREALKPPPPKRYIVEERDPAPDEDSVYVEYNVRTGDPRWGTSGTWVIVSEAAEGTT